MIKTFFAALVGVLAAIVIAAGVLLLTGSLHPPLRTDRTELQRAEAEREARRAMTERHDAERQMVEVQEQRRERVALLAATLGARPAMRLTTAEKQLFQEAERRTAMAASEPASSTRLVEPVQIDERTVLQAATRVEFIRYETDNLLTVRYDGASYQVSPCQTELRAISGDVCQE